jgi:hypothetical protein
MKAKIKVTLKVEKLMMETGSNEGRFKDGCLLGCSSVAICPDDGGSKDL